MAEIIKRHNKEKIKKLSLRALAKAGWAVFTTAVVIAAAGTTIWLMAAFTEPSAGPSASNQDFAQNIMGANNADNDFNSSSVAANADGSIIERIEYVIDYLVNGGAVCGNGVVEIGEGCDDGGTSWTSGACAGDCSRRNYWSEPVIHGSTLATHDMALINWCNWKGFRTNTSQITSVDTSYSCNSTHTSSTFHYTSIIKYYGLSPFIRYTSTYNATTYTDSTNYKRVYADNDYFFADSKQNWNCSGGSYDCGVCLSGLYTSSYYTKEIWCTD